MVLAHVSSINFETREGRFAPQLSLGRTESPNQFGYVTSTLYALVGRVVTISVTPCMAGLALVTPRTAVQGGHGLAVKTMFCFNPSSKCSA